VFSTAKFVRDIQQVGNFLQVLRFPPSNKTDSHNITEIFIFESGVKHHFNNISTAILWWSGLLVEETGLPGENWNHYFDI
jgi:hypothetical protein